MIGADQVAPRSVERSTNISGRYPLASVVGSRVKNATSVPSFSTTIWLLIVCPVLPGS